MRKMIFWQKILNLFDINDNFNIHCMFALFGRWNAIVHWTTAVLIGRWCCIVFHCKKSPRSCLSCCLELPSANTHHSTPFSCCIITIIFFFCHYEMSKANLEYGTSPLKTLALGLKINFRLFMEIKRFQNWLLCVIQQTCDEKSWLACV